MKTNNITSGLILAFIFLSNQDQVLSAGTPNSQTKGQKEEAVRQDYSQAYLRGHNADIKKGFEEGYKRGIEEFARGKEGNSQFIAGTSMSGAEGLGKPRNGKVSESKPLVRAEGKKQKGGSIPNSIWSKGKKPLQGTKFSLEKLLSKESAKKEPRSDLKKEGFVKEVAVDTDTAVAHSYSKLKIDELVKFEIIKERLIKSINHFLTLVSRLIVELIGSESKPELLELRKTVNQIAADFLELSPLLDIGILDGPVILLKEWLDKFLKPLIEFDVLAEPFEGNFIDFLKLIIPGFKEVVPLLSRIVPAEKEAIDRFIAQTII